MRIDLRLRIPSPDFPDDVLVEFESFYYFVFEIALEAFPNSNLPSGFIHFGWLTLDTPRRELYKTLSAYHHATNKLRQLDKKYYAS